MPISFTCPHCGLQTTVAEQYAGQSGPCAGCGKTVTIPPLAGGPSFAPPRSTGGPAVAVIVVIAVLGVFVVCGGILIALLLPAVQAAREAARRAQCSNNLKQIALALHNYHDVYKCFPPAVITDKDGKPMRSWRVAILPFMEQKALYDRWNFNEPWNSPNNRVVASAVIPQYRCPSDPGTSPTETTYVMITGKGTIGGLPNEIVRLPDITDGSSNTIIVVEVTGTGIAWAEPRDLTLEELSLRLNDGSGKCIGSLHPGGANVAMADGSVRFISDTVDPQTLRRLILRNDGQAAPLEF